MGASPGCDPCDFGLFLSSDGWNNVCSGSSGGCLDATLYSPSVSEERAFHPEELREATVLINDILEALRKGNHKRRKLAFLRVPGGGLMLAWSNHKSRLPDKGVITSKSSSQDIKRAMGLIPYSQESKRRTKKA
jgi:hypothetical protein